MNHCIQGGIGDGDGDEGGGHGGKGMAAAGRLGGAPPPNPLPPWLLGAVEEPSPCR